MTEYRVEWFIDIEAEGPKEAAQEALNIQRDPNSIATSFEVYLLHNGQFVNVFDLSEEEG